MSWASPSHGSQLPRRRTPQPSGSRSHPARPARDPPVSADLLLVIAPEAGDPDDTAVALAACAAARQANVPVVARAESGAVGTWMIDLGVDAAIARAIQKSATAAHESQSDALPELIRRLDLRDGREGLRWLVPRPLRQSTARRSRLRRGLPDRQRAWQHPAVTGNSRTSRRSRPGQEPVADAPHRPAPCLGIARHAGASAQYRPVPRRAPGIVPLPDQGQDGAATWLAVPAMAVRGSQGRTERSHMNTTRGSTAGAADQDGGSRRGGSDHGRTRGGQAGARP